MKSSSLRRFAAGLLFTVVAASFLMALPVRQKAASGYHLIKTVSLPPAPGGDEYYDYLTVDADARRLYVSHGTEVVVLNADNYSVVGKIGGLTRSHGIAIARDLGKRVHLGRRLAAGWDCPTGRVFRFEDAEDDGQGADGPV